MRPRRRLRGVAVENGGMDGPGFFVNAPCDNFHFKAVGLHVDARSEKDTAHRDISKVGFKAAQ